MRIAVACDTIAAMIHSPELSLEHDPFPKPGAHFSGIMLLENPRR
jgi:hypothetical protein